MHKNNGFTLVELLSVLAIIAAAAAIAVPSIVSWLPDNRLRGAVREVESAIQLARLRAVKENTITVAAFSIANDTYRVFVDTNGNGTWDNGVDRSVRTGQMPAGVEITATTFGGGTVQFNGRGLVNGGIGQVTLTNSQGTTRQLAVNMTGNIRSE